MPPPCGAYGSSLFPTGPHTDGTYRVAMVRRRKRRIPIQSSRRTKWSVVVLQYRMRLKQKQHGWRRYPKGQRSWTHLALASLTFILGLARSSLSRWLCSRRRRSLSSDIDCLCGRFIVDYLVGRRDGLNVEVWGCRLWERVSCHFRLDRLANSAGAVGKFAGGGLTL